VAQTRGLPAGDIVVNLQGDEPMMPPAVITRLRAALDARPAVDIATAVAPIGSLQEFLDPSCVKALRGLDGRALYFSRAPVPWPRDGVIEAGRAIRRRVAPHRHLWVSRARLLEFASRPPTYLEMTEKLEQLRALEYGMSIHLVALAEAPRWAWIRRRTWSGFARPRPVGGAQCGPRLPGSSPRVAQPGTHRAAVEVTARAILPSVDASKLVVGPAP